MTDSPPAPDSPPEFLDPPEAVGELGRLGPYRVIELLGQGGMGHVYRAQDTRLQRTVALKVMNERFAKSPNSRKRIVEEARSMAAVHHDNVATLFEVGQRNGTPFLAMELLQGGTLEQLLQSGRQFSSEEVIAIADQVALGLEAAHDRGIIHRDIKPANLWIQSPSERVKILDFGLAVAGSAVQGLARGDSVVGTPGYLSPEQARNETVDERTDLYSLGVVMYEMCAGKVPLLASNTPTQLVNILCREPLTLSQRKQNGESVEVPEPLERLIMRLLSKEPGQRYETAGHFRKALLAVSEQIQQSKQAGLAIDIDANSGNGSLVSAGAEPAATTKTTNGGTGKAFFAAVGLAVAALIAGGVWWMLRDDTSTSTSMGSVKSASTPDTSPAVLAAELGALQLTGKVIADPEIPVGEMARFRLQLTNQADSRESDPRIRYSQAGQVARITTYLQQEGQLKRKAPAFPRSFSPRQLPAPGETQSIEIQFLTNNLAQERFDVIFELQSPAGAHVDSLTSQFEVTENLQTGDLLGFETIRTRAGKGADTYVREGSKEDFGKQPAVMAHRDGANDRNVLAIAFLRFDLTQLPPPSGAGADSANAVLQRIDRSALLLSMAPNSHPGVGRILVHGWPSDLTTPGGIGSLDWSETGEASLTFETSPVASGVGDLVPLGELKFDNSGEGLKDQPDGLRFVSRALDDFLRSSPGVVTLVLSQEGWLGDPTRFNSRDRSPELAPGLAVRWKTD
ncbi:serine/threonine-protein kinase [Rhodopirellula baltica]|uniref:serine/threonine-protein kinase n=1 Tax=Rhodopirellula baltica TaxID=265606 RepID=UPI0002EBD2D7|nr:serine/threonine-protein kinase [Rhodopirellula baltica]